MNTHSPHGARAQAVPIVIDIEASGFGPRGYPIEIGLALPDNRGFCALIRPEPEWTFWDEAAETVHHIPRSALLRYGRAPQELADALNAELTGQVIYSDGWANDYTWLNLLFEVAGRVPAFRLENLRRLLSEDEAARWHDTKTQMQAELRRDRHRASADARLLQLTLLRIKSGHQLVGAQAHLHEIRLLDEMVELDALTLSDLLAHAQGHFDRTQRREQLATALAGGARVLAEHLNHRLAAYVLLRPRSPVEWEILSINLHPWYRSTGLYRRLLTRTLAHLISHGAHTVSSLVLPGHEQSARMHERMGFVCSEAGKTFRRYRLPVADLARRLRQG